MFGPASARNMRLHIAKSPQLFCKRREEEYLELEGVEDDDEVPDFAESKISTTVRIRDADHRENNMTEKKTAHLVSPFHLPALPLYQGASLVAQTVKNLQCGRPGFDSWIRQVT